MKIAKCMCEGCNEVGTVKLSLDKRGGRPAYVCAFHYENNEWYHAGGRNTKGTVKANAKQCGIEFESAWTSDKARIELLGAGFTPTDDCSLEGLRTTEYVSPRYSGMNAPVRYMKSIEKMMQAGDIELNASCGTHFHFSINNMKTESGLNVCEVLRDNPDYYNRIFAPVSLRMTRDVEKTERVFGRYFTDYCDAIRGNASPDNRYYWVNVTNQTNIEFRLFKFVSAAQYTACMKFAEKVTVSLMNNLDKFEQMTESEKLHKCDVVAKKIVKMYEAM